MTPPRPVVDQRVAHGRLQIRRGEAAGERDRGDDRGAAGGVARADHVAEGEPIRRARHSEGPGVDEVLAGRVEVRVAGREGELDAVVHAQGGPAGSAGVEGLQGDLEVEVVLAGGVAGGEAGVDLGDAGPAVVPDEGRRVAVRDDAAVEAVGGAADVLGPEPVAGDDGLAGVVVVVDREVVRRGGEGVRRGAVDRDEVLLVPVAVEVDQEVPAGVDEGRVLPDGRQRARAQPDPEGQDLGAAVGEARIEDARCRAVGGPRGEVVRRGDRRGADRGIAAGGS